MNRAAEFAKYEHCYATLPDYRMGEVRMRDAKKDVRDAFEAGCRSYLDIGCGRGEMLRYAENLGFTEVAGAEVVPELCGGDVFECPIHDLHKLPAQHFDLVTCFDVIEHVLPGDDSELLVQMGRIARKYIALTANNRPSHDPTTGADLHINIKSYREWDLFIREMLECSLFEPAWHVEWLKGKEYVSETWRACR